MRKLFTRRIALLQLTIAFLPLWLFAQTGPSQLHITSGGYLVMKGKAQLVMNNIAFDNDGSFIADSSNVRFIGEPGALANSIMGNTNSTFNNLTLHTDPVSGVFLQQGITLTGTLGMEAGLLMLNGNDLNLGGTGKIVGESSASRIEDVSPGTGAVYAVRKLFAPQAVNPGNIGVEITSNANLGITKVFRYFQPQTLNTGGSGIARWYTITPSSNMGLDATLRVHYLDAELNGNGESALHVWTGSDLMDAWLDAGVDSADVNANWVQLSNIDHFNRVTLASGAGTAIEMSVPSSPVVAYPNPSHNQVALSITSSREKDVVMGLYDQTGHLLQRRAMHLHTGPNTLTWDLTIYPTGIYFIGAEDGSVRKVKMMKL